MRFLLHFFRSFYIIFFCVETWQLLEEPGLSNDYQADIHGTGNRSEVVFWQHRRNSHRIYQKQAERHFYCACNTLRLRLRKRSPMIDWLIDWLKMRRDLVPFTLAGDFIRSWKESAVMSGELVPTTVIVVRHHQQVVDVPANCYSNSRIRVWKI